MIIIVPYVDNLDNHSRIISYNNPPKAHLASINSAAESEFVWSLLVEGQQYWIDGKKLGEVMCPLLLLMAISSGLALWG